MLGDIVSRPDFALHFYNYYVVTNILDRFNKINERKPYHKKIKPFNFITVGTSHKSNIDNSEPIIPMLPYIRPKSREYQEIPYMSFIDYKAGKTYPDEQNQDTRSYWKPLSEVIHNYTNHPEIKSEGDNGLLTRRRIVVNKTDIYHIGKETNELDDAQIMSVSEDNYTIYTDYKIY